MAKSIDKVSSKSTPTIISADLEIEGDIKSNGVIEIEGSIKGNIKGNSIIIREGGRVVGSILCESLQLKGKLEGELSAKSINISSKGYLKGNIEYGSLSVEDGALIDGQFKKLDLNSSEKALPISKN